MSKQKKMARRKKSVGSNVKDRVGKARESTRRRRSQQPAKFSNYVFKVLKQVHRSLIKLRDELNESDPALWQTYDMED